MAGNNYSLTNASMSAEERNSEELPAIEKEDVFKREVNECGDQHGPSVEGDANLDTALEEAAKRRNLSTLNVKSIIHVRNTDHFSSFLSRLCLEYGQIKDSLIPRLSFVGGREPGDVRLNGLGKV